ncbi:MAG: PGPGW domain-containing protein [Woeseiaceae bacterium]|jgi:tellurite resistance protein TerC|nr:PGPGW domain-containing protein [Woeseiaceae bacterium]
MIRKAIRLTYKAARRIAIGIVGATVVLIGAIMLVTPGPGLVVIPVGLAILSLEFAWARQWLRKVRESISRQGLEQQARRAAAHRDRATDDFGKDG